MAALDGRERLALPAGRWKSPPEARVSSRCAPTTP